ncbi:hypothetical protein [Spirosoma rhododendri]|uniref:Uncharacterized protein n=1 Tax=Spirosoma rhododendri TaxID=2728024 RepID=A0A7L5DJM5_9BACT|nr:hypothetical protein [Spirosoma rhododendri]QJD78596.1 hypothetical protein HH216_09275 [Spirosoma rhododendri]
MKRLLMSSVLVAGLAGQALSMGHPHNVFAAHKRIHAKLAAKPVKTSTMQAAVIKTVAENSSASLVVFVAKAVSKLLPTSIN